MTHLRTPGMSRSVSWAVHVIPQHSTIWASPAAVGTGVGGVPHVGQLQAASRNMARATSSDALHSSEQNPDGMVCRRVQSGFKHRAMR